MPQPQKDKLERQPQKASNRFAGLELSDSEEEEKQQQEAPAPSKPSSPPFRTWKKDDEGSRFKLDEGSKNIFSTPFSRGRRKNQRQSLKEDGWISIRSGQPLFEDEEEAAILYEPKTPPFFPDSAPEVIGEDATEELADIPPLAPPAEAQQFPSLLTRGLRPSEQTAFDWAEKIKQSLEKAEEARTQKHRDQQAAGTISSMDVGRLSFFKRPVVTAEPQ